ncbi:unnamed protein product [Bursaphelenchus xylophilus]|uniref:(pine wood nematode) hypothetical protein n=1 Tax=Bursaphelenchus xylophilus TaxID=6326 RepID=A0A1I7SQ09_BURXY|nr:unnamed protein product [Bursaphelenchus xylophilus]CAG9109462.1 unnamed protein product [Bursaphelenchus xylophilus]
MSKPPPKQSKPPITLPLDKWILSTWGRRFRIGTLAATVTVYPIYYLIVNGPLAKYRFKTKVDADSILPERLEKLVSKELQDFKDREARADKDTVISFYIQKDLKNLDTVAVGSLGVRFGAHIGLPLPARFDSQEQAKSYCKEYLEPLKVLNKDVCVVWDTKFGDELIGTFHLSDNALRFLIARDILTREGYQAYANAAISWATWTAFSSLLTYWLHLRKSKGFFRFFTIYTIITGLAVWAHIEWHKLYRYMNDIHSDSTAAKISASHCLGGIEYYVKLLKRHQLLRSVMDNGSLTFTPAGDRFGAPTKFVVRYSGIKDIKQEFAELAELSEGDVF